jgi:NTE family protein
MIGDAPGAKPRVALALGAGGAKGLAHIGVIETLHEAGYEIAAIAGSSMGALVGGIHALGKLDVYSDWVRSLDKLDVLRLVDWTLRGPGLIKGERIISTVRDLVGDADIETLPIAYTAVATDLERQREVWLSRGPLFDAIRASIAIPTVFHPHAVDSRLLVDGGLLNPVPVTPLLRERYDVLIAVSLDGPRRGPDTPPPPLPGPYRQRFASFVQHLIGHDGDAGPVPEPRAQTPGLLELLGQAMELMQGNLARLRLAAYRPDLLIELPCDCCAVYEFYRAEELIALGHAATTRALADWRSAHTAAAPPAADHGDAAEHRRN